jgi:RNA polymerase sigma-70 factor (ECF subfamily)
MAMMHKGAQFTSLQGPAELASFTDGRLIERVRAGDPVAFELIMRRYNQRLFRMARSILRNGSEAEDVVQDSYVRAYEKIDDFIGPAGFSAWLGRIVINEALGRLRTRGRVISLDDFVDGPGNDTEGGGEIRRLDTIRTQQPDPERLAVNSELRRLLETAIDALPDDFRVVFVLRAVEGLSVVETAEYLSIRPETVKTRFHRARRHLQDNLGAQFETLMPSTFAFAGEHCDRIVAAVLERLEPSFAAARRDQAAVKPGSPQ